LLLSIILPTTGRESLSPCLRSFVAAGAGLDDEVVIVVDAIPGEWGRIAATITASQIDKATNVQAVFLSTGPHNDVGGAARNAGLATAMGLWACYMDDDDAWKPGVFAYLRDAVASARTYNDLVVFRVAFPDGSVAWRDHEPVLAVGNVSTIGLLHSLPVPRAVRWRSDVYENDFHFAADLVNSGFSLSFNTAVVAAVRP